MGHKYRRYDHNNILWVSADRAAQIRYGTLGWISDTVDYASEKEKPVLLIDPIEQSEKWVMD